MKKSVLFFLFFIPFLINAKETNSQFNITCKVLDQVVIGIEEGKPKRYSSIKDGLKEQDFFDLTFDFIAIEHKELEPFYSLTISNDKLFFNFIIAKTDLETDMVIKSDQMNFKRNLNEVILNEDYILLEGLFGNAKLERYYKDDWQFIYSANIAFDEVGNVITANCMNVTSKYDLMLKTMQEFNKRDR